MPDSQRVDHDRFGWWVREARRAGVPRRLDRDTECDVAIVGGGYLGLWTAWHLSELEPNARVVLLERELCGFGPSGRNGGFVNGYWDKVPRLARQYGTEAALALGRAAADAVVAIGDWCRENDVDAWYRHAPQIQVATSAVQEGAWLAATRGCDELGIGEMYRSLTPRQVAEHVRSPAFGGGAAMVPAATVQPARLCFGLRDAVASKGVRIFEHTQVDEVRDERVETAGGTVRAGAIVLATNADIGQFRPVRNLVATASSHIVLTEPVPDVLEDVGWTGHEGVLDFRTLLHYFRTTEDGRIAFGWGGGRMGTTWWHRGVTDVDPQAAATAAAALVRFFPRLSGRRITHAWGGRIDVSSTRLPQFRAVGNVLTGFGFTGNGVGPAYLGGQILSRMALDRRDDFTRLLLVEQEAKRFPPEPLRLAAGSAIRAAMVRRDRANDAGSDVGPAIGLIASLPRRFGLNLPR
jgi:glycine/D-amino acid oxidase-like deaminating enzyme